MSAAPVAQRWRLTNVVLQATQRFKDVKLKGCSVIRSDHDSYCARGAQCVFSPEARAALPATANLQGFCN